MYTYIGLKTTKYNKIQILLHSKLKNKKTLKVKKKQENVIKINNIYLNNKIKKSFNIIKIIHT